MSGKYGWEGGVKIGTAVRQTNGATFGKKGTILERDGTRGTRQHSVEDTREGPYTVEDYIPLEPDAANLASDLAWALGTPTAQLTPVDISVKRVTACYLYASCVPDTLELTGSQGALLKETLGPVGTTEAAGTTFADPNEEEPILFSDCVFTVGSVTCTPFEFTFKIDNKINKGRFLNSLTVVSTDSQDQEITLRLVVPNDATHAALYGALIDGTTAGSIVISGCGTLSFGALQAPPESAPLAKDELKLTLTMTARKSAAGVAACAFTPHTGS